MSNDQNLIETIEYKDFTIKIHYDECPQSPREDDNLGTIYAFHRRYNLGDKHDLEVEDVQKLYESKDHISLPVYMYEHGGVKLNTSGFSCPWDSGQVGIVIASKQRIREDQQVKYITKKVLDQVYKIFDAEIEQYSQYLNGEISGFTIVNPDGEIEDSCYGFYSTDDAIHDAKYMVDSLAKDISIEASKLENQLLALPM